MMLTRSRHSRRRGYAMALLIVVMTVTTAATALVLSSASLDAESSRQNSARAQARVLARSGADEVWARISLDPTFLPISMPTSGAITGVIHPAVGAGKWARLDGGGAAACSGDFSEDCYHVDLTVKTTSTNSSGATASVKSLRITVTSRVRCGGVESRCVKARVESRLRKKQFFDYLYFTKYSVLDPRMQLKTPYGGLFDTEAAAVAACADKYGADPANPAELNTRSADCLSVSFQGEGARKDVVSGPVYSFDNWVSVCGNPTFDQGVFVRGSGHNGKVYRSSSDTVCAASGNPQFTNNVTVTRQQGLSMPSTQSTVAQVRSIPGAYRYQTDDTASLRFTTTGVYPNVTTTYNITGIVGGPVTGVVPIDTPAVFFFDRVGNATTGGNVLVSGRTSGRLSVFSTGDLIVDGDLLYAGGTVGNTTDITGLTSLDGAIKISKSAGFSGRTVHAMLLSLDRAIQVDNWWVRDGFADAPTLTLYGAIAAKYQGVFGGYDSVAGVLVSGYRKNFIFDDRLRNGLDLQPPYLVNPLETVWERLDVTELPPGQ